MALFYFVLLSELDTLFSNSIQTNLEIRWSESLCNFVEDKKINKQNKEQPEVCSQRQLKQVDNSHFNKNSIRNRVAFLTEETKGDVDIHKITEYR